MCSAGWHRPAGGANRDGTLFRLARFLFSHRFLSLVTLIFVHRVVEYYSAQQPSLGFHQVGVFLGPPPVTQDLELGSALHYCSYGAQRPELRLSFAII
jgi:hypothetical protein